MKKISLLLSTLGGAMGGYLLSNKKLRDELLNAKDTEEAARSLGKHLQRDGKKIVQNVREFVGSEEVQRNIDRAKKYTKKKADEAKKELRRLVSSGARKAKSGAKKTFSAAKRGVRRSAAKTVRKVKRAVASPRA